MSLTHKHDFAIIISVRNANPNGDPLNGNRPRVNYSGHGEISDVCLKRKLRNRLMDEGESIFVQSDGNRVDEHRSLNDRYDNNATIKSVKDALKKEKKKPDAELMAKTACEEWYDIRAFGQVLAGIDDDNASIAIRGPVSIQSAFSVEPIDTTSLQITKTVNLVTNTKDPSAKSGDTMGMKHRVDSGVYVTYGSINRQLAEKTGFNDDDALKLQKAMLTMFENDESSARPAGSMEVLKVIWWTHDGNVVSSAKTHKGLVVNADGTYTLNAPEGVSVRELDGE